MPDPDFNQIARGCVLDIELDDDVNHDEIYLRIAEQLRLVWNARGAADIAKLEDVYDAQSMEMLERALRTLDR